MLIELLSRVSYLWRIILDLTKSTFLLSSALRGLPLPMSLLTVQMSLNFLAAC